METRDERPVTVERLTVERDPVVVVTSAPTIEDPPAPAPRRGLAIALVVGMLVALAGSLSLLFVTAGDDDVVTHSPRQPASAGVAAPAALAVVAEPPDRVVAGQVATFVIRWTDGAGIFSGTSEDWGDGVGASSVKQGRCEASTAGQEGPIQGEARVRHAWAEPGTYTVVLGATTYTCAGAAATAEDASTTLTVEVQPAP